MNKLVEGFKEIHEILLNLAIDHWLDAGTLLWYWRNGYIKPDDKDIDLGAHYEQVTGSINDLKRLACFKGYDTYVSDGKVSFVKQKTRISLHLYKIHYKNTLVGRIPFQHHKECYFYDKHKRLGDIINYLFLDGLNTFSSDCIQHKTTKERIVQLFKNTCIKVPNKTAVQLSDFLSWFAIKMNALKYYHLKYPVMFFNRLKLIEFYGIDVCVPKFTEVYLSFCYGNWRLRPENYPRDGYYKTVASRFQP